MDPRPTTAPAVVAVVVTCDPGPWLEECLAALGAQDYPSLSILVVDAGSLSDVTPRVAQVLPSAYVRRLEERTGYAAAANEVLSVVEGAALYLMCHDDVAPAPNAVRAMVEEAFRSNAGLVTGKLVDWDQPERLLQVGMGCDKFGAPVPIVERGELDQSQHDGVRDVAVVPGGCVLVRADLFATVGGYDPAMTAYGEDLDLSWRAQLAGARTLVAPAARIRHREALSAGLRAAGGRVPTPGEVRDRARILQLRHRLRAMLATYRRLTLAVLLPQLILLNLVEVSYALLVGRRATARAIGSAWWWNLRHLGETRARRRSFPRAEPDAAARRLQIRGSARLTAFLRGQLAGEDRARFLAGDSGGLRSLRIPLAVWGLMIVVVTFGSRHLIGGPLPLVGELAPFPGVRQLLDHYLSGWRVPGLGGEGPAPPGLAVLAAGGALLLGNVDQLQKLLVLGTIPVGILGTHRLARPLGSPRGRLLAVALYAFNPMPYDALARGRWSGLLSYAAAPWLLSALARSGRIAPYSTDATPRRMVLGLGLGVALLTALAPSLIVVATVVSLALLVSALLAGDRAGAARSFKVAAGSVGVAIVLLFPWSLEALLPGATWASVTGAAPPAAVAPGLGQLLRFEVGPVSSGWLGWLFMAAAALPLLVGREWRLAWAIRAWVVALSCIGVAWAEGRGWLPVPFSAPDALLAPAAAAFALSAALGLVAFEVDLRSYRFGWRQVAGLVSAVAAALAVVPVILGADGGRWRQPRTDLASILTFLPDARETGSYRVLWIGAPEAVPLPGWGLGDGLVYATSLDGLPTVEHRWPGSAGSAELISDSLRLARKGETTRLGHLLSPMSVRYVIVARRLAPEIERTPSYPVAPDLDDSLRAQIDLKAIELDASTVAFENVAWAPRRAALTPAAAEASRSGGLEAARATDLAGSPPVLVSGDGPDEFRGVVPAGSVLFGESASDRWVLDVDGRRAQHRRAFGWANSFEVSEGGSATLRYRTSLFHYGTVVVQLLLWVAVVRAFRKARR